jgi:segregation and condensation protein B
MPTKEIVAALKAAGKDADDQAALDLAKAKESDVTAALLEVQADLAATGRAFQLVEQVNGWTLVSDPGAARWIRQLYPEAKPTKLSGPQLETLAIIAYRQPVTRADIEAVRGVAVDGVMQILLDRGLVRIAGRAEVPGRPLLYTTTEYFLQHFGLRHTDELPNSDELKRIALPTATVAENSPSPAPGDPSDGDPELSAPESGLAPIDGPAEPAPGP